MQLRCPRCWSKDIRRSKQSGLLASILRQFSLQPFRCRNCRKRFYRASDCEISSNDLPAPKLATLPVTVVRAEPAPSLRRAIRHRTAEAVIKRDWAQLLARAEVSR